jgi:hypothetical protein
MEHERRSSATPPVGSGSRSHTCGLRLFGRGQGNRQFFQGAEVTHGRLGCRSPRRYRERTGIYRPGADAGTAYEPVAGFDPTAFDGSRASPHSARQWLFGNLLQYWYQPIFLLLKLFQRPPEWASRPVSSLVRFCSSADGSLSAFLSRNAAFRQTKAFAFAPDICETRH